MGVEQFERTAPVESDRLDIDFLSDEFLKTPWPHLQKLAAKAPVFWSETQQAWILTRHADVKIAHTDSRFSARRADMLMGMLSKGIPDVEERYPIGCKYARLQFAFFDGTEHRRIRNLMVKAFSKSVIETFRLHAQQLIEDFLDQAEATREFDFVKLIAERLPCSMVQRVLGVRSGDTEAFFRAATAMQTVLSGGARTTEEMEEFEHAATYLRDTFSTLIEEREANPTGDLLSQLVQARDVDDRLNHDELLAACFSILDAGSETTAHMLGVGLLEICNRPDLQSLLRDQPEATPQLVDELMRYPGLVRLMHRVAAEDFEYGGQLIRKNDVVYMMLAAANVDVDVYENPLQIDPKRKIRETMAFGYGAHHCIGHLLAKMELQEFFTRAFQRFEIKVLEAAPPLVRLAMFRGYQRLPVKFVPRVPTTGTGQFSSQTG